MAAKTRSATVQQECRFSATVSADVAFRYLVYLPEGYETSSEPFPLLLFLHGSGERGEDLAKVKLHGPPFEVERGRKFPFILVSPQCPEFRYWDLNGLVGLLGHLETEYRVDPNRIYITGLSMGGYATFGLAALIPHRIAAALPICGAEVASLAPSLTSVPIWAFHGTKDTAVPIKRDRELLSAIKSAGGNAKLKVIKDGGHGIWADIYAGEEVYKWLYSHKLSHRISAYSKPRV